MRGQQERSGSLFSYVSIEERIPASHPLRRILRLADQALDRLNPTFCALYAAESRPSVNGHSPRPLLAAAASGGVMAMGGDQPFGGVSATELARWGLLEQVARERCIDELLRDRPLPGAERLMLLREDLERRLGLQELEPRQAWLARHGLVDGDLDRMAARSWQWLKWCRDRWGSDLQTIFLQRKAEFDQVTYSLLRLLDGELASELYLQIKEGDASFSELAAQFSGGPEKRSGGLLGPVPLSQPHPALAKLLQVSKPGQVWPPKSLEGWWVVVRLEKLEPAILDPAMQERLLLDEGDRALRERLQQLG